ncbi:DUF3558 domain-containing protein [Streptomyces brasiliensis]|uniref:DUF3558 domain-containing protein n=1 Tax=Streptomyces brasiliensis TaxID=1954 RepID=A0A917P481_9ACTN|nr:DUF3558 domain-containing protein [Streptomyces brasiliensis]GGJ60896.1 hypothetical protein GCM10010121_084330 [Streptomyces brasiliensis]
MQRKAYVTGTVALLAALLAGCTGGSDEGGGTDNSNPGAAGTATAEAQPGKYRTLPDACGAVSHGTLDSLLPGIKQLADPIQQDKAYAGDPTLTYDTDRKVACRWKVESADATDHLLVDFERVVSYDNAVSDDSEAQQLFATKETAADLPEPSATPTASATPSSSAPATGTPSASASASVSPADLQPRVLSGLGDEAYLDDQLSGSGPAEQRTVTVAFRTSNVIVTIEYAEQPAAGGTSPDSKEMQDRARNLAAQLSGSMGD